MLLHRARHPPACQSVRRRRKRGRGGEGRRGERGGGSKDIHSSEGSRREAGRLGDGERERSLKPAEKAAVLVAAAPSGESERHERQHPLYASLQGPCCTSQSIVEMPHYAAVCSEHRTAAPNACMIAQRSGLVMLRATSKPQKAFVGFCFGLFVCSCVRWGAGVFVPGGRSACVCAV